MPGYDHKSKSCPVNFPLIRCLAAASHVDLLSTYELPWLDHLHGGAEFINNPACKREMGDTVLLVIKLWAAIGFETSEAATEPLVGHQ